MNERYVIYRLFFILIAIVAGCALASGSPVKDQYNFDQDTCDVDSGEYRTQTQGGWGQDSCDGNNVACIRDAYFGLVFPNGLTIGGTYTVHFTSSAAVAAYLPRGGTIGVFTQNYVNPTDPTSAGVFASQVLALKLNVAFGDYPVPSFGDLGSLIIDSGPFADYSVDELLALANTVLGGNLAALPPGRTLEQLNNTIDIINHNFVDGNGDGGYLHEDCCEAPDIVCWSGNPAHFNFGQAVSISAVVTNPDHDPYTVVGRYVTSQCTSPAPVTQTAPDQWTLTVPENCTQNHNAISATFVVTDSCGKMDSVTCEIPACSLPTVECWEGNPTNFEYGQPLTVCAIAGDPDNDLASVTAEYTAGACHAVVTPTFADGRWCVTIPGSCTETLATVTVVFTATDSCGGTARDTCLVPADCIAPEAECWDQNPSHFVYGQGLTACAIVTDANNDVISVEASYHVDGCTRTVPAENAGGGRWCVTIPDSCTRTCGTATIIFTATDACGLCGTATCIIPAVSSPPSVECWAQNPPSFAWGQPLEVCALVTDPDNNLTAVSAHYVIGTCSSTVQPIDMGGGRWCVTIPGSCTQTCSPAVVTFTATDGCGLTGQVTCHILPSAGAPEIACWNNNPAHYGWGQPVTISAMVQGQVTSVTAHYVFGNCDQTVAATDNGGGRWSVTVPGTCTRICSQGSVLFTAIGMCGGTDTVTCHVTSDNHLPIAECWEGNPVHFSYGQPLEVCAVVTDADNNINSVSAHYTTSNCDATVPATFSNGRWCVTVPGSCTQTYADIQVIFTATDSCGGADTDTCSISTACRAPEVNCWNENPGHFTYGQAFTVCAIVTDPDNDVSGVTATYILGDCNTTVAADNMGGGRWCVTVPANCAQTCAAATVIFTATDECGRTDVDTCLVPSTSQVPTVECWSGNPGHYVHGQPLEVCAIIADPDNDIASVTAHYVVGTCSINVAPVFGQGRWCVTIPANCTQVCGSEARVTFTATDTCAHVISTTCVIPSEDHAPVVSCWPENPPHFNYGEALIVCANVTDADNNLMSVTAHYDVGNCTAEVPAIHSEGRWCVTIPENCTETCSPATIIFTALDSCNVADVDTCIIPSHSAPPVVECWAENPDSFAYDQPLTVCAMVSDMDGNVTSVMAAYSLGSCQDTLPATDAGNGRWCVTIPTSCTQFCEDAHVAFMATDACGNADVTSCTVYPRSSQPPYVLCETSDPAQYIPGQPVIAYASVNDPDHDVVLVTASYATPTCTVTDTADYNSGLGQWYVTIPGSCTSAGGDINVTFTATDHCGLTGSFTCLIPQQQIPCGTNVNIHCWPGNPITYSYGIPISVCAVVDDSAGAQPAVTAQYQTGVCTATVPAAFIAGRWCVQISGNCTQSYDTIRVTFTVMDTCLVEYSSTCVILPPECHGPVASCWPENPAEYTYDAPLTVCVDAVDPENDVVSVTAHYLTELCDTTVWAAHQSGTRWCVTIPAACTQSNQPIQVQFTAIDQCGLTSSVTCTIAPPGSPGPGDDCCLLCVAEPALVMVNQPMDNPPASMNLVIRRRGNALFLHWSPVPGAAYYEVYRGNLGAALDQMERVGLTQSGQTDWAERTSIAELPNQQQYYVRAYQSGQWPALEEGDRGQWEMNEGIGDTVHDASGYGRHAVRWANCPPDWGSEYDSQCDSNFTEFMDFDGYVFNPNRCAEHLRAPNDSIFYADSFQVFARIRIHQHPTSDTGPFYIVSNRTYGTQLSGGFGFRIEPGWYTDGNYVRHWHNRLLGLVWDRTVPDGMWRTIVSAQPTPQDTVTNSVPLDEWVCVWMIVNGTSSSLMINDLVVATGDLTYRSLNTGAPMVIGGGYHLNSLPVEHPFRGEMDCVRITDLP